MTDEAILELQKMKVQLIEMMIYLFIHIISVSTGKRDSDCFVSIENEIIVNRKRTVRKCGIDFGHVCSRRYSQFEIQTLTVQYKMEHISEESKYYKVDRWCRDQIYNGRDFLFDPVLFDTTMQATSKDFDFPLESLRSFFQNTYVKHIKARSHGLRNDLQTKYITEYLSGRSIIDLAKEANFPPALLARRVVEEMTDLGKKKLSIVMKNPLEELERIDIIKEKYKQSQDDR